MHKIIRVSAALVLLLVLHSSPQPAWAAWIAGGRSGPAGWFAEERVLLGERESIHDFALYDNLSQPLPIDSAPVVLCPANRRFVPLVLIDRNPQLRNIIARPTVLEVQVADILYANLKMQQLLNEYQELREQSARILAGLSKPDTAAPPLSLTPSLVELAVRQVGAEIPVISERLAGITAAQRQVGGRAAATGGRDGGASLQMADASLDNWTEQTVELQSKPLATRVGAEQKLARIDALFSKNQAAEKLEPATTADARIDSNRRFVLGEEASELPWVIRFLLAVVQFVFANKVEILGLSLVVLVFVVVLGLIKGRVRR